MEEVNLTEIQKQISEIYNYLSKEFEKTKDKKTMKILNHIFKEVHSILKKLSKTKEKIKNLL